MSLLPPELAPASQESGDDYLPRSGSRGLTGTSALVGSPVAVGPANLAGSGLLLALANHVHSGAGPSGGSRSVTLVVALSDSSAAGKAGADFVCTGTNDQVTIQAANAALGPSGGTITLLEGHAHVTAPTVLSDGVELEGQGSGVGGPTSFSGPSPTTLVADALFVGAAVVSGSFGAAVRHLAIDCSAMATPANGVSIGTGLADHCYFRACARGVAPYGTVAIECLAEECTIAGFANVAQALGCGVVAKAGGGTTYGFYQADRCIGCYTCCGAFGIAAVAGTRFCIGGNFGNAEGLGVGLLQVQVCLGNVLGSWATAIKDPVVAGDNLINNATTGFLLTGGSFAAPDIHDNKVTFALTGVQVNAGETRAWIHDNDLSDTVTTPIIDNSGVAIIFNNKPNVATDRDRRFVSLAKWGTD